MAHLSSSFSSQNAGQLEVVLKGVFIYNVRRDAGFPSTNGTPNALIRGYVGPVGGRQYTQPIDRYAPTVTQIFNYPGGNVVWDFGTETIDFTTGGATGIITWGFEDLRMDLVLRKSAN